MVVQKDPWLGVAWKVYAVQGADGSHLKPSGKEGTFSLNATRDPASGQTAFYTVEYSGDDMPPCWQALVLYPHGNLAFSPPSPPLHPWTPSGDAPWLSAADAVRRELDDTMARLEGVLHLHKGAAIVTWSASPTPRR